MLRLRVNGGDDVPDFDFRHLSSRSFEQLVQSLALREFGPLISIFGDGPDGGREATFEGPTSYGVESERWSGYGVIQAKFRQRSGNESDRNWALKELRAEIAAFESEDGKRRIPDYYVFATNVVLSPVAETGGLDLIRNELANWGARVGLRGYDVWHYDKLCVLLTNAEDVRKAFNAWILPGDVLAVLLKHLENESPNFPRLVNRFLQKDFLTDQYARLEQGGHAPDERIPLANVFVDLPTAPERHVDPPREEQMKRGGIIGFVEHVLSVGAFPLVDELQTRAAPRPPAESAPPEGRYVLIGGPGQGKTTLGQFLCQVFRAGLLLSSSDQNMDHAVQQALPSFVEACQAQGFDPAGGRRFPIRVVLNEFAKTLADGDTTSLLEFMVKDFNRKTSGEVTAVQFLRFLATYPCFIVLDGLDEVPASTNREQVLEAVQGFWVDVSSEGIDAFVVATSRPQGYNDDFAPRLYRHRWLIPLPPKAALTYGKRLTAVRFAPDADRVAKVTSRLERAAYQDATARLMRSPLQVTILTLLVDRVGHPPQERWTLFREYYNLIYQREVERNIPSADVLRSHKPDIDTIHHFVALVLQVNSETSGGTDARLTTEQLSHIVEHRLADEGHRGADLDQLRDAIIEGASNRLVFLVGVESGQIGFEIRSLQEFMAAEGIMDADDATTQRRLKEVAPSIHWRNTFLFAAGKCFSERQYLRETISSICHELNEDPDDPVLRRSYAGSQLALELLEDGPARRQPRYSGPLARAALSLLRVPDAESALRLAEVFEPALFEIYAQELEGAITSGDEIQRRQAYIALAALVEGTAGIFDEFGQRHLTEERLTNENILSTVGTGLLRPGWLGERIKRALPRASATVAFRTIQSAVPREPSNRDETEVQPQWLAGLIGMGKRSYRLPDLVIDFVDSGSVALGVYSLASDAFDLRLITLSEESPRHSSWDSAIAMTQFQSDPTRETLAVALDVTANSKERLTADLAWPLEACIVASPDQDQRKVLAAAVREGLLGDTDDWLAAERRWREEGIGIKDLKKSADLENLPFDSEIGQVGFPLNVADRVLDSSRPQDIRSVISTLRDVFSRSRNSSTRRALALILANLVMEESSEGNKAPMRPDPDIVAALLNAHFPYIAFQWIGRYWRLAGELNEDLLDLFPSIPINEDYPLFLFVYEIGDAFDVVHAAWRRHPNDPSIVQTTASLAAMRRTDISKWQVPEDANVAGADHRTKAAFAAILARRGERLDEVRQLAQEVRSTSGLVGAVADATEAAPVTLATRRGLVLDLAEMVEPGDTRSRQLISNQLEDLLREQPSSLTNESTWLTLGFPHELALLLAVESNHTLSM